MTNSEKELFTAFLGKTLNLTADEVASLFTKTEDVEELKPEALETLLKKDAAKIKTLKDEGKTLFDNGFKKAESTVLAKLEKEIKEKYGVNSEKQGIELVEEIVTAKAKKSDLEEDKVKTHPFYLKQESEWTKKISETEKAWKEKYEGFEKEIARKEMFSEISKTADAILTELKVILPTDPTKAANQKRLLFDELRQYDYLDQEGKKIIMKEGKRLENAHGVPIDLKAFIDEKSSQYWERETGTARKGSGGSNDEQSGKGGNTTVANPKTEDEYIKAMGAAKDGAERIAIMQNFEANVGKGV